MTDRGGVAYAPVSGAELVNLRARLSAPVEAVPTPFAALNAACKGMGGEVGLAFSWYFLIAALSGGAKTMLALNFGKSAIENAQTVAFHSLEMGWDELAVRILAMVSGEPAYRLSPGKHFDPLVFDRARGVMDDTRGTLLVNSAPMFRLSDLLTGIERTHDEHGSRVHIVDYMQLAWTGDAATMYDRVTEVSHAVRALAKRLRIVVIGLSQLNRETSKLKNERPTKEGMIGGSSLENDADQVLLIDHSRRVPTVTPEGRVRGWIGWACLDKNRHGPPTDIPIRFDQDSFRIRQRLDDEVLEGEIANRKGVAA